MITNKKIRYPHFGGKKAGKKHEEKKEFYGVIDYIFWRKLRTTDEENDVVISTLELPTLADCKEMAAPAGFPRENYPSDHLPVAAKFSFESWTKKNET